ncbi:MAG: proline--tRNA ligase [Candidatus Puniceispirillum sp.]|nr:proline--tRNA ligase [Candidatus Pelagibacter sp.]MBA4282745.1 proline--tRNA ligase [Candidatus Puniceispirillum sp.]
MKLSTLFSPVLKQDPSDAVLVSHRLMLRSGMIVQSATGLYSWLPMGVRVLENIINIVAQKHDEFGCSRMITPILQSAELWKESGRYEDYGKEMLRVKDRHDRDFLFGPTNEEVMTDVARKFIQSYKQLPQVFYQITWKFRDEMRPRFGIMRAREFLMKDAYSFDLDFESAQNTYKNIYHCYLSIFDALGVDALPVRADSGAIGGNLSHEFHVKAEHGESTLYYDSKIDDIKSCDKNFDLMESMYAVADEKHIEETCPLTSDQITVTKGIEIGHIFYFGTKYSESMDFKIAGKDGQSFYPEMGSYGIGMSRLVAAMIEANHDENGIIWPEAVAPFLFILMPLDMNSPETISECEKIYQSLKAQGYSVLIDDRDERPGVKFSYADLIGIPHQIILGKDFKENKLLEYKNRKTGEREKIAISSVDEWLKSKITSSCR